jgi:hypothetical protein
MVRFDDTTISFFIDAIRIGFLARFNEMVLNKFCKLTSRMCLQNSPILPNINGAKFQSVQQIVDITSNKAGTFEHEITPFSIDVPIKKDKIKVGRLEHDTNETKMVRKTLYFFFNLCFQFVLIIIILLSSFNKTLFTDERLMHERNQLMANNLLVNINEPINIDKHLVGMWISISWERKSHIDNVPSFFTFDAGVILSYKQNSFNILYEDG